MENKERLIIACMKDENDNIIAKCFFFDTIENLIKEIDDFITNNLKHQKIETYIGENNKIFSEEEIKILTNKGYKFD